MEIIKYPNTPMLKTLFQRSGSSEESEQQQNLETTVSTILTEVKQHGDKALRELTARFDGATLNALEVTPDEMAAANREVPENLQQAIRTAAANIETFHLAQRENFTPVETMPGVRCWRKSVPVGSVGLYIPGGTAPLFSTVLMLGIPARIAGCREVVLCTPPGKDGKVHPAILFAAGVAGIKRIFKVGGAQAVAALAYGTESIPRVDKIFGPGNRYVTCAKMLVQKEGIAIDLPAGPSEVMVFADDSAVPAFVAADLLSQAEHDTDSQVVFLTTSEKMLENVLQEVESQSQKLPRQTMIQAALENSIALLLSDNEEALTAIDTYAPEHLILACENAEELADKVSNAGSVFLGNYAPESAGDYASGTNHTLPTNGFARSYSGVSLDSFYKKITFQHLTAGGLRNLASTIVTMAEAEELPAHAAAVKVRLEQLAGEIPVETNPEEGIHSLVRHNIRNLRPYSSARSLYKGNNAVLLDANENAHELFGENRLHRYPDPLQQSLKEKIGRMRGVSPDSIFLGNGSDEAIDLLLRIFCEPEKDEIIVCPPTYGMYEVLADTQGAFVKKVLLDEEFQPQADKILAAATQRTKLLFLCSPNNPTGNVANPAAVEFLLKNFPGIVVVDEAYQEFSEAPSWSQRLPEFPKLVVLQTFSKAWALAGLRLGMAFAHPAIIGYFNKVKYPYNLSQLTQKTALQLLEDEQTGDTVNRTVEDILSERTRLSGFLKNLPNVQRVFPSDANFLLVKFDDAAAVFSFLKNRNIIVRNRSHEPLCDNCLRISIGTREENDLLMRELKAYTKSTVHETAKP